MALDEVAVIDVRDAHEVRKVGGCAGMKRAPQLGRRGDEIGDDVGQRLGRLLGPGRLYALDGFRRHFGRFYESSDA